MSLPVEIRNFPIKLPQSAVYDIPTQEISRKMPFSLFSCKVSTYAAEIYISKQIFSKTPSSNTVKNASFITSPYYANCFHRIDFLFRPFIFLKRRFDLMKRPYGKTVI